MNTLSSLQFIENLRLEQGFYIYQLVNEDSEDFNNRFKVIVAEYNEAYDSYGNEQSTLKRVFEDKLTGDFVLFEGTKCSYAGEEWCNPRLATPKTKTITIWE